MSTASVAAVRSLKRIEQADARAANALLSLLSNMGTSALVDYDAAPDQWFVTGNSAAFAISVEGIEMVAADVDVACDALDAAESTLQQAEELLGMEFDPRDLHPVRQIREAYSSALVVRISSADVTLWIALQPDAQDVARWEAKAAEIPANKATRPARINVILTAARLTLEEAAGIDTGDLLLLQRMIPATIIQANMALPDQIDGQFDGRKGAFRAGINFDDEDAEMPDDELEQSGSGTASFAVPITLRLPGQFIDAATLAALAPGYVLPLAPLVQGLQVDLLVGGRRIARGEIVELGDSFAVHIDERVTPASTGDAPNSIQGDGG